MPFKSLRRMAFLKQVEADLKHLDDLRPLVNETGRIEEFANLYARAFIAKLLLMR
jgi:hypothetical protein